MYLRNPGSKMREVVVKFVISIVEFILQNEFTIFINERKYHLTDFLGQAKNYNN